MAVVAHAVHVIRFASIAPHGDLIRAVAADMGLSFVAGTDGSFAIEVPNFETAYQFGLRCGSRLAQRTALDPRARRN